MPTYERLTYLSEALDSVLAQTFGDFEVVVSDNGSSAEVRRLVESRGDARVRYRHNGENIGLQANMLAGYRAARAELVTTLHDDDVWEPTFLARLVPPLQQDPSISIAFCDYWVMGPDGAVDVRASQRNSRREGRTGLVEGVHEDALPLAVVQQAIQVSYAAVFRRSVDLDAVPADLAPLYDLWIAYLATVDGAGAWYCAERLTRYRHHGGSATANAPFYPQEAASYARFLDDHRLTALRPALRRKKARAELRSALRSLLDEGDAGRARRQAATSLRTAATPLGVGVLLGTTVPGGPAALRLVRDWRHKHTLTVVASSARGSAPA